MRLVFLSLIILGSCHQLFGAANSSAFAPFTLHRAKTLVLSDSSAFRAVKEEADAQLAVPNPFDLNALPEPTVDAVKKLLSVKGKSDVWIVDAQAALKQLPTIDEKADAYAKKKQEEAYSSYNQYYEKTVSRVLGLPSIDFRHIFPKISTAQQQEWLKLTGNCGYTLWRITPNEMITFPMRQFTEKTASVVESILNK